MVPDGANPVPGASRPENFPAVPTSTPILKSAAMPEQQPVLEIRDLTTQFLSMRGMAKAVDTVTLDFRQGETLAVVGESGCGKTVLALSVLGLVPDPPGRVTGGEALYRGRDLLRMSERQLQSVRGNHISMVFQEPMTSLNPVFRIGEQIAEGVRLHLRLGREEAMDHAREMLARVGIPSPELRLRSYPHELSGGMRQRVMIAMGLSCNPDLLIADEPTTALDVTIQAQIMDLLRGIREDRDAAVALITHDLGVVASAAQRVAVMYAGQIVEHAPTPALYTDPLHPYTRGLLGSVPRPGERGDLSPIPGMVPSIYAVPPGCRFQPRCPEAFGRCAEAPPLFRMADGRTVRCWLHEAEAVGDATFAAPRYTAAPAEGTGAAAMPVGETRRTDAGQAAANKITPQQSAAVAPSYRASNPPTPSPGPPPGRISPRKGQCGDTTGGEPCPC